MAEYRADGEGCVSMPGSQTEVLLDMSQALATPDRIKRLIVESLHLEGVEPGMIEDEAPLFGEGLGLDSVDALELVVALEKEFGIKIKSQELGREVFSSVASLSQFIEARA